MIVSYRDKRTREFAAGKRVKAFSGIDRSAQLKLDRLEAAVSLKDLAALLGNRLEALIGDRKGQYSIRINDQWRICFEWPEGSAWPSRGRERQSTRCPGSSAGRARRRAGWPTYDRSVRSQQTPHEVPRPVLRQNLNRLG